MSRKAILIGIGILEIAVGVYTGNLSMVASGAITIAGAFLSPSGHQQRQASIGAMQFGEVPREALLGEAVTGGSLVDCFNWGGKYGTDWEGLVIALADHECDSLLGFYVEDKYVPFTGNGPVAGYNGQLEVYWRAGTADQAVVPLVLAHGPGWTADDRGEGICDVFVAYKADASDAKKPIWPSGRPTRFRWHLKGAKLYSPRDDGSLAGGSGASRRDDPSTWVWGDNPIDCRYSWVRGFYACNRIDQPEMLLVGRGLTAEEAPPENVFAPANLCDETVDGAPRYRMGGVIRADEVFSDVEDLFAAATGGIVVQRGGSVEIEPGQAKASVATITDDDLLAGTKVDYSSFLSQASEGWVNTVIARYVEPAQAWNDHAAPVRRDTDDVIADGGPREKTVGLGLVTDAAQAGRIGEIVRRLGRLWKRGGFTLGPRFCELEEGDWIVWTSDRYLQGESRTFRVEGYSLDEKWRNTLRLREINATVYSDGAFIEDGAVALQPDAPPDVGQPGVGAWNVAPEDLTTGGASLPVLVVTGACDDQFAQGIVFEYWMDDGVTDPDDVTDWVNAGIVPPTVTRFEIASVAPGATYYVAVSYLLSAFTGDRRILGPVIAGDITSGTFVGAGDLAGEDNVYFDGGHIKESATGPAATLSGFRTDLGTAAAIAGQGALATKSSVAYGSGDVSGFGTLAGRSTARLGTEVYRADGTTVTTDSMVVTSLGTAAAIAGQGSYATLSQTYFGDGLLKETSGGVTATLANFKTSSGTAAAIAGQGALATKSSVAYGSGDVSGFGTLAGRSTARLGTEVYRADGTTVTTDSMVVTSLGTAAAIAGQGALATKSSVAYGSGDVSGFGTLAGRSTARLGTEVYRADGTTVATDSMVVTSLGTASAIAGQGALATLSNVGWSLISGAKPAQNAGSSLTLTVTAGSPTVNGNDVTVNNDGIVKSQYIYGPCRCSFKRVGGPAVALIDTAGNYIQITFDAAAQLRAFVNGVQQGPATSGFTGAETFWLYYDEVNWAVGWDQTTWFSGAKAAGATLYVQINYNAQVAGDRVYDLQFQGFRTLPRSGSTLQKSDGSILGDSHIVTLLGTAAAITGQGGLATASYTYYGTGGTIKESLGGADATLVNFKTSSGTAAAIAGQGALATLSTVDPSTSQLKATGSVPPTIPDNSFTYTSTTNSITISWPNLTLYRVDGTTVSVGTGSVAVSGLAAGTIYKVYAYVADSGGTTGTISFVTGGSGAPTIMFASGGSASAAASMYARGNIPMGGFQVSTPASGTGGGGGGGSASCPHPETLIETPHGFIRADRLEAGDLVATPDGWAEIVTLQRAPGRRWIAVQVGECRGSSAVVSPSHVFYRADGEIVRAESLRLGDLLRTAGDHAEVTGLMALTDEVDVIMPDLPEPHLYFLGRQRLLSHNPIGKP